MKDSSEFMNICLNNPQTDTHIDDWYNPDISTKKIRGLLIRCLSICSVRKEMCIPILLMVGENREYMLKLMFWMRDNNPTEHQIFQKIL